MKVYCIANWKEQYETAETKKLIYLKWVPVPNKHDGLGFRRMSMQRNAADLFTGWNLMLQVASKGHRDHERGKLIRNGRPLTDEDLAMMTGFPVKIFTVSLEFFSSVQMSWLHVDNQGLAESPAIPAESPVIAGASPAEGKEGKEGKGKANESPQQLSDDEWVMGLLQDLAYEGIDVMREYRKMLSWCQVNKKSPTRKRFINWLNRAERPLKIQNRQQQSAGGNF